MPQRHVTARSRCVHLMHLSVEHHPGTGPYLLLVHGFLTGRAQWTANLGALQAVCRPVVVELWGHGRSPSPTEPRCYHPAGYAEQFERIRHSLGASEWFVCGYSLGAGLTIQYALTHPERVSAHAFTNSTSGFADEEQVRAWRDGGAAGATRIREGGRAAMERIPVHPRHARRLAKPLYDALLENAAEHDPEGIADTIEHTTPFVSVRDQVGQNTRPALLINGLREKRFQAMRDFAAARMPHLDIADLEAGHGVNLEMPAAFNEVLIAHLRAHS
jgi:pimeloyl-ACP methyl ester carboxylesterase